jgi:hypothetical protein
VADRKKIREEETEHDRKTCIALNQEVMDAERERREFAEKLERKAQPAPIVDDVVSAPLIWGLLPQAVTDFLYEHRQIRASGMQPQWVALATLKAAVLAGKAAGWFVADYNPETGEFLGMYCASCTPDHER